MPVICHLCDKPIKTTDKFVAYGEATGQYYFEDDYMDDIEPAASWVVVHFNCFYTGKKKQIINSVYVFDSGMVAVFDKDKQQIPEYQGYKSDVMHKIMKDKPKDVEIKDACTQR